MTKITQWVETCKKTFFCIYEHYTFLNIINAHFFGVVKKIGILYVKVMSV